jgi:hypothetical protein
MAKYIVKNVKGFAYYWNNNDRKWEGLVNNATVIHVDKIDRLVSDIGHGELPGTVEAVWATKIDDYPKRILHDKLNPS